MRNLKTLGDPAKLDDSGDPAKDFQFSALCLSWKFSENSPIKSFTKTATFTASTTKAVKLADEAGRQRKRVATKFPNNFQQFVYNWKSKLETTRTSSNESDGWLEKWLFIKFEKPNLNELENKLKFCQ